MKKPAALAFVIGCTFLHMTEAPSAQVTPESRQKPLWGEADDAGSSDRLSPGPLLRHMELNIRLGNYDTAESIARDLVELNEATLRANAPEIVMSLLTLGWLCAEQAKNDEAETHYRRALQIVKVARGHQRPDVSPALSTLAGFYRSQGRYREADLLYHRLLSTVVRRVGHEAPIVAVTLRDIADLYRRQGKFDSAEPYYEYALAIFHKTLGAEHAETDFTESTYASMKREQQRLAHNAGFVNLLAASSVESNEQ